MANDQVLTGGNSFSAPSAGIGAVILNDDQAQKNEDDAITNANTAVAAHQQKQAAAKKNTQTMMAGLNLDPNGARPQDIPYFQGGAQKIMQNAATLYGAFNGDLSSPQAQQLWMKNIEQPQREFQSDLAMSKGVAKLVTESDNERKSHPDFYDEEAYGQNVAHLSALGIPELKKHLPTPTDDGYSINTLLQPKVPDLDLGISKLLSAEFKKPTIQAPIETVDGIQYQHQTTENFPEGRIRGLAEAYSVNDGLKPSLTKAWANETATNPEKIAALEQPYIDAGDAPPLANQKAKVDWLEGKIANEHYTKSDQFVHGILGEQARIALAYQKQQGQQAKDALFGEAANVADFWNGKPEAVKAFMAKKDLGTYDKIVTVQVPDPAGVKNPDGSPKLVPRQQRVSEQNSIIDGGITPDLKHYIVTRESTDPDAVKNSGRTPQERVMFDSPRAFVAYVDDMTNGKFAEGVYKAYKLSDAITATRDLDTEKFAPPSKWKPVTQTGGTGTATGTFNGAAQQTNKPAVSGYRIGQTQGGYKYTGGDPTKPENWEKQ